MQTLDPHAQVTQPKEKTTTKKTDPADEIWRGGTSHRPGFGYPELYLSYVALFLPWCYGYVAQGQHFDNVPFSSSSLHSPFIFRSKLNLQFKVRQLRL